MKFGLFLYLYKSNFISEMKNSIIFTFAIIIVSLMVISPGCKKNEHPIPYAYVDFYVNINSTQYVELNSAGGWVNLTGGYKGILVYRLTPDLFMAYDRACPYDFSKDCGRIAMDPSGLTTTCPCCNSKYNVVDGSVINGPSKVPLRQYRTDFDGEILHIFN